MWSYFDTLWNKLLKLKSCCFDDNIGFDFEAIRKIPYVEIVREEKNKRSTLMGFFSPRTTWIIHLNL